MKASLLKKIQDRSCIVGVIGLGYVGLPVALRFADAGFKVIGFDIDPAKVRTLNEGESYIGHIPSQEIQLAREKGKFEVSDDFKRLTDTDAIIICVPTPLDKHRKPDLSFMVNTTETISSHLKKGQLISLESTTHPGTTEEELLPRLLKNGYKVGEDFFLVYSPEREDPGNNEHNPRSIPKVVGGITPSCLDVGMALYSTIAEKIVPVSSTKVAEAAKLLENIYRAVNIALVNELKMLYGRMEIDTWEVIEVAKTKPFGFQAFYPGPGFGGHCIPVDPFYLTWKAKEYDFHTKFIELAGEINTSLPYYVVQKTIEALNKRSKLINNARILLLGVAYKKDVADIRESPALKLIELFHSNGMKVFYNDPYIPKISNLRKYRFNMESVELDGKTLRSYDCVVIVTDHSCYDYGLIQKESQLIVDTRNVFGDRIENSKKVVKA